MSSSNRAFNEHITKKGRVAPVKGNGFTYSEVDYIAARTPWLKYKSISLQDEYGDVRVTFDRNTPLEAAIKYRDTNYPKLKVVFWQGETPRAKGVTRIL